MSTEIEILRTTENDAPLAGNDILRQVATSNQASFFTSLRIKNPTSVELGGNNGDWVFGKDQPLGPNIKILVGPWRLCAMRFKNNGLDSKAYNRTQNSKIVMDQNGNMSWQHPCNSQLFIEILENKINGKGIVNHNGFEFLCYLPEIGQWCAYFYAAQQKAQTMQTVGQVLINNLGKCFNLGTTRGAGKNHYYIPTLRKLDLPADDPSLRFPGDYEKNFKMFVNTDIEVAVGESTGSENKVER